MIPLGTIVGTAFAIYYGSREIYLFYWFIMTEPYKYIDDPSLDKFRKKRFKYYALILAIGIPLWVLTH